MTAEDAAKRLRVIGLWLPHAPQANQADSEAIDLAISALRRQDVAGELLEACEAVLDAIVNASDPLAVESPAWNSDVPLEIALTVAECRAIRSAAEKARAALAGEAKPHE